MLSILLLSWLACAGSPGADPSPDPVKPVAESPQPPAPAPAPAATSWRAVVQYGEPELVSGPEVSEAYDRLRGELVKLDIFITGAFPPYGEVKVRNPDMAVIGTLPIAELATGRFGWILAEQGRDPVVVQGLETSDGRLVVYSEIERYFGVRLGL